MLSPQDLKNAFLPNRVVSPTVMKGLAASQLLVFFLIWWQSPFVVLPQPGEVFEAFGKLWSEQGLGQELIVSIGLFSSSLLYTTLLSLALSYLTVIPFFRPLVLAASKGRFLGLIGLTFVFTLMIGGGHPLKVALLVFGMSVFFVTSMASVVEEIPRDAFDHARTLGMSEGRVVLGVVILGTADKALEVIRQNAAIGWTMLTMVEGISRSDGGVGAMLLNQNKHFHLAEVFAIQLTILLVGISQDYALGLIRQFLCPYASLTLERR